MSSLIPEGTPAPDFEADTHDRGRIRLSGFRGRTVVLYFYPKDHTPGCTVEACGFRETTENTGGPSRLDAQGREKASSKPRGRQAA